MARSLHLRAFFYRNLAYYTDRHSRSRKLSNPTKVGDSQVRARRGKEGRKDVIESVLLRRSEHGGQQK